jgi:hypothetical protein
MKYFYLPFLFILAFVYTNFTVGVDVKKDKSLRAPAAITDKKVEKENKIKKITNCIFQ